MRNGNRRRCHPPEWHETLGGPCSSQPANSLNSRSDADLLVPNPLTVEPQTCRRFRRCSPSFCGLFKLGEMLSVMSSVSKACIINSRSFEASPSRIRATPDMNPPQRLRAPSIRPPHLPAVPAHRGGAGRTNGWETPNPNQPCSEERSLAGIWPRGSRRTNGLGRSEPRRQHTRTPAPS